MRHEITMPQLGMTQDSGVIVSWGRKPGDAVKADDILMEVETDKSTMEVEAGHDGFLREIRVEAGLAVPVGDVVAVISDSADDVVPESAGMKAETTSAATGARSPETTAREAPRATRETPASPPPEARRDAAARKSVTPAPAKEGATVSGVAPRILASPKAKMEAHRRGLDLARLARQGVPQPFHVADLEEVTPAQQAGGALSALAATVERAAFDAFREWAAGASAATSAAIWAAFATASWRSGTGLAGDAPFTARVETLLPIPTATVFCSADARGLGEIEPGEGENDADLVILDLVGSGLADYRSGGSRLPTVTVTESGDRLCITLGFDETILPVAKAAAVLAALAGRVGEPLRHLL